MTVSIQPVSKPDLPAIGELNTASKLALVINRVLWPNWPDEKRQYENCFGAVENSFKDESAEILKAVDDDSGEIVGAIILTRKPAKQEPIPEFKPEDVPEKFNPDVFISVMKAVAEIAQATDGIAHLQITFMVVKQGHRRQGIGSQLVGVAFDRAKALGQPIITQAEPAAYDFFKKLGFQDTKHHDFDLSVWATPRSGFGLFRLAGIIWKP